MTIIGSASVEIRADDKKFEADVQQATDKIKEMVVKLKLELDEGEAKAKLDELRAQLEEADDIKLKVKVDLEEARVQMDEFFAKYEEKHINMAVKADTEEAKLKLDELAHDRTSTIKVKVDSTGADLQKVASSATGGGGGGANGGQNNLLTTVMTYSHIIELSTLAINGVGALSDSFVSLAGVVMSVGQNVAQVIGLAAAAPAAFGSLITVVGTAKALFTGFGGAISGNAQALAALPPSAQKAALAVGTLKDKLLLPMQHTFWDYLNGTFQNTIKITLPALKTGLDGVSLNLAHFVDDALFKFQNLAKDGTLGTMFNNLNDMLHGLELAFHPFLDAFATLGTVGSSYLPKFGGWIYTIANQFGVFVKNANDAGKINDWINTAIVQLQNVWKVGEGALGILSGLTHAFDSVPTLSLGGLADELKSLAAIMNGPIFQQDAGQIFGGMVQGSIQMRKAFTEMFTAIGNNSQVFGAELSAMGGLVAAIIHDVMALFTPELTAGLIGSTKTLTAVVEGLKPTFTDLGNIIGNLLGLVDGALKDSVPAINTVAKTVDTVVSNLKDGIGGALPVLGKFIDSLLNGLAPILVIASKLLDGILLVFDGLPRPIQDVTAALGLLLLLKFTVLSTFFDNLKKNAKPALDEATVAAKGVKDAMEATVASATKATEPLKEYQDALNPRFDPTNGKVILDYLDESTLSSKDLAQAYRDAGYSARDASAMSLEAVARDQSAIVSYKDAHIAAMAEIEEANRKDAQLSYTNAGLATKGYEDIARGYEDLAATMDAQTKASTGKVKGYVDGLGASIGGVGVAWHNFTDAIFSGGANLDEGETKTSKLKDAFANLKGSIGDVGQASGIGKGVGGALSGLVGFLGGPWGIALAGASIALDAFGQAQQDTQAKVDALSKTLDAQGRTTGATKTQVATGLVDSPTDTMASITRGLEGGAKSTTEFAAQIGISLDDVAAKLTDPKSGDAYRANWDKIKAATKSAGGITDALAASVGLTAKQLNDAGGPSIQNFVNKVDSMNTTLTTSEIATKQLADATGLTSGAAQILTSNYDVLTSQTSTVSDKFNALKTNLDLVTNSQLSAMDGQEAYGKSVSSTSAALQQLMKDNKGQINDLVDMSGKFNFMNVNSAQLYDTIKAAKDGILQQGASVLQQAISDGNDASTAQKMALDSMQAPIANLVKTLSDLGLSQPKIDSIIKEMGLVPDKLVTAIGINGTAQAKSDIAEVAIAAQAFATGNYAGALAMLPDAALKSISEAVGAGDAWKRHDFTAIIDAANQTGPGIASAIADTIKATEEDKPIKITGYNATQPGIDAAKASIMNQITGPPHDAVVTALFDGQSGLIVSGELDQIASKPRRATIDLLFGQYLNSPPPAPPVSIARPTSGEGSANGSILNGLGQGIKGFLPSIHYFLNGGVEDHVAQISMPKTPYRVWAEPETGGEAYIPLSPAKRNRSENILNTVADQFGFSLVKKFENGGLLTQNDSQQPYVAMASNSGMQPAAPQIHVHPSAGMDEKAIGVAALHELNFQIQHGI
jgi:hypothetical protein